MGNIKNKRQILLERFCEIMHINSGDVEKYYAAGNHGPIRIKLKNHHEYIFTYRSDYDWEIVMDYGKKK